MEKWDFVIILLLGLLIGWLLTSQTQKPTQDKKTTTTYHKLEEGFRIVEDVAYE